MKKSMLLAAVSTLALAGAARADGPSHVKVAQCGPLIRQELTVIVGHPLVILFPKGETTWLDPSSGTVDTKDNKPIKPVIEVIAEDRLKDDRTKNPGIGNLYTLWPDIQGVSTLTVVVTTPDNSLKAYPFTLTALADGPAALADASVTLNLICSSSPVTVASTKASAAIPTMHVTAPASQVFRRPKTATAEERAVADERIRTTSFNGTDNICHYHAKGKNPSRITPLCPMDNGQWTLIRFPGLTRKPAVYIGPCEDGNDDERLARQHGSGDFVVVEEIAALFCLRLGSDPNDVLEIVNDHYDPVGKDPGTGTTSPDVHRDLIQAKSNKG